MLAAVRRRVRLARHRSLQRSVLGSLQFLTGKAFDESRELALELALCPDPATCQHL